MGRFYRAFFIMIAVCAFHMPVLGAGCPNMASKINKYTSGDVKDFLNCDYVTDGSNERYHPFVVAISGYQGCPGNLEATNAMLKVNSGLVSYKIGGVPVLQKVISECCGGDDQYYGRSCKDLKKKSFDIAKLLIESGANINEEVEYRGFSSLGGTTKKGTLLDFVREHIHNNQTCTSKDDKGRHRGYDKHCKNIESLLVEKGVKTYAELHGDATESAKTEITPKDNEPAKTESAPVTQESTNVATVAPTESENTNTEQNSKQTEQLKPDDKKLESTEPKESTDVTPADTRNVVARGVSNARSGTGTIRVSGVVLDATTGEPLPFVNLSLVNNKGTITDVEGKFSRVFQGVPLNSKLTVSYVGYEKQTVDPGVDMTIMLKPVSKELTEVKIQDCSDATLNRLFAKVAKYNGTKCVPTVCVDGYRLENGGTDDALCVEICSSAVLAGLHASNGRPENNQCVPTGCVGEYELLGQKLCCRSCKDNTNATCVLSMLNSQCHYETACKTGYETIVNSGAYNAYCTNAKTYQITLSWDNGAGGTQSKTYEYAYDKGITISDAVPTDVADGFRFLGWCENSADCNSPQSKIEIAPGTSGEKTYYAKFVRECSATELNDLHATSGNWIENQCVPTDCVNGYNLDGGVCVEICDANAPGLLNAETVAVRGKICVPTKCIDEYKFDDSKNPTKCIWMCDDVDKTKLHAKTLVLRDGKCVPSECESDEFILRRDVCVDKKLQEQVKGAEEEYASARENEMSLKSRLMSGAAIGATGIGGMQLASGIAEQSADADAAADMAAYTQKMQCRVGGRRYDFNEKSVNVGGENSLTGLYSEYVALADDMLRRRTELEQSPGIESAIVFKREYTGLYDDVGSGVQNGTYASLYRASIGNENDISRIADDAVNSQTRIKTGAVVAGVGAAGGTMGNILGNYVDFNKSESE